MVPQWIQAWSALFMLATAFLSIPFTRAAPAWNAAEMTDKELADFIAYDEADGRFDTPYHRELKRRQAA